MGKKDRRDKAPIFSVLIGTGFGSGFWPWGPGTAGALLATLVWFGCSSLLGEGEQMACGALHVSADSALVLITALLVLLFQTLGIWAANRLEPFWGEDPSRVVVDEMVGVWIALLAAPAGHVWYGLAAFVLFRFFDIVKPFGVRHMEKMGGGVGVMMDDVLAGVYSFFILYLVRFAIIPLIM